MSKRRAESSSGSGSDSGSSSSSSSNESDAESGLVTSPKKRQRTGAAASNSPPKPVAHDSDSETSDSDDDWDASGKKKKPKKKKAKLSAGKHNKKPSSDNESHSDPEEGEVSDNSDSDDGARKSGSSSSYSSSESEEEFNDGYDENLMGDDNDQARLASMTEKEREEELFNRNERREVMRTRFEIEKKLKAAKRKEQHKKKSSHKGKKDSKDKGLSKDWGDKDLDKDVKERSKERKKTVEENKGKTDKKAQAMTALKARREEKKEREEKEKQRIEDRKNDDKDGDLDGVSADANKKKLKASDVYSDDSGSDSDSGSDFSAEKHGAASKSSFPSSTKRQQSTLSRVDSHTTAKPKGKSRGRPVRSNLSVKELRIMELLAPYKVLHFGRPLTTLLPGDIRRRAIIAAATMLLIPLTDFNLPEDISGLSDKEKETAKLALELFKMGRQNHESGVVEPLPPNVALLTGLRGLLLEITRVDLSSMDIDIGDPDMDAELLRMFKSFFGGWCQPFLQSFNSNGYGQHGKAHTNSKSGDPVVADYGNSAAATVFITHADKPHVRRIGSSSGDAGDEEDDIAGDRPYTEGSPTELTPRRSTRTTTPAKCMSSSKDGGRNWSDADKQNLISILENSGFNSDFSHLASQLKNRSVDSLRYLVDYLLSNRVKIEWELDLDSKIDQLLDIYPSSFLTENLHLILKLKSLYGRVPDPSQVGGIKYAECYLFLSSLMGGHVPQGISKMTKHKLFSVFFRFMKETIAGPKHTKCIFEKKNVSHFEINNVLCDRRKRMWTAEEARAREVIESGNMDQIRIFYCSHSVLNPL